MSSRVGTGMSVRSSGMPPGSSSSSGRPPAASNLSCNKCSKPLATTCFLCSCDCIFCEAWRALTNLSFRYQLPRSLSECTYSHFERSSQCPTCGRRLAENDFTELVVADANTGTDVVKSNMQSLLTKKHSGGMLQYSEICQSLIRQVDSTKQATKFLLKQLLLESHKSGRNNLMASRTHEALQAENTQLKQLNSSQRLQYEQTITTLQNKLNAREATIAEQNKMIDQFRKYHGGGGGGGRGGHAHMVPNSSSASFSSSSSLGGGAPPLRGLMAQREANKIAQQNTLNGRSQPFMNAMQNSSRSKSPGANFRPFSGGSTEGGSVSSNTPRIRDLSAGSGYHFTGMSNHNQPLNKRRRGGTPGSMGNGTPHTAMSPTTAFTLNQGPNSHRPHRF
eukprot:scaffold8888_cov131-Skeletonema_marinoi.AAC.1